MTPPPTLDYATPPLARRLVTPTIALLMILGTIHLFFSLIFSLSVAFNYPFDASALLSFSIVALFAATFIIAANRIHRHSRAWAWIALIATFANLATLFVCLAWSILANGITNAGDIIMGLFFLLFTGALTALVIMLPAIMRELRPAP
jgi:hypothetical protein